MGFSYWSIVLYSAFFPFIACVLILLTPGKLKKYTVKVIDLVFFFRIGTYPLINIVMFIEGLTWLALFRSTWVHYQDYQAAKQAQHHPDPNDPTTHGHPPLGPMQDLQYKSKMWREQRNCYVAAWGFTSWWYVFYLLFLICCIK